MEVLLPSSFKSTSCISSEPEHDSCPLEHTAWFSLLFEPSCWLPV